ncbi:MAG: tRNA 2-thiouridine(34) synthase MnmA [Gammaproteobacteria bacterium]|nr:tRNA 2-thiouridine(34) synthase MnmA [Gammaproteobacteria bacterium]
MPLKQRVIVGMSGGVDSSVAALLLLEQGHQVEGLFMKNWQETDDLAYCSAQQDLEDAEQVCADLEIPLHTINFSHQYWDRVFTHFLNEYQAGRTPNPDVLCNKEIKFKAFLDYALRLGADKIATGHYARVTKNQHGYQLLKGVDASKDQSYFLHLLGQHELSYSLFPLGELEKANVRELATQAGFVNHEKKDSTGICFIGERRFRDFLARYLPAQAGEIVTLDGKIVGKHAGALYYTIGQREGLGIGGLTESTEEPWYVIEKDVIKNQLIVVQGHNHPALFHRQLISGPLHWINAQPETLPFRCQAKIRYRQSDQNCRLTGWSEDSASIEFDEAQRAVTTGQSIVFYRDDVCLGGGIIERL